eukprot:688929-Pyramimonas_sp.AAC.1
MVAGTNSTSTSVASVEGAVDLPTVVRQWARGMHHCGRALAVLQQSDGEEDPRQVRLCAHPLHHKALDVPPPALPHNRATACML